MDPMGDYCIEVDGMVETADHLRRKPGESSKKHRTETQPVQRFNGKLSWEPSMKAMFVGD